MHEEMLKMCRCCLIMNDNMVYVANNVILDLITLKKISKGWVCWRCNKFLKRMLDFREACLASEELLLSLVADGVAADSSLIDGDAVHREKIHCDIIQKLYNLSKSNTLSISVITEQNTYHGQGKSKTNVWSLVNQSGNINGKQNNYSYGMLEWDGGTIQDFLLPLVKTECGEDDKGVVSSGNEILKSDSEQDDARIDDHNSDTDDETYNVPLINVANMSAQSAKQPTAVKCNGIKREKETRVDNAGVCESCLSTTSQLSALKCSCKDPKTIYSTLTENNESSPTVKDCDSNVVKVEPADVEDRDTVECDVVLNVNKNAIGKKKKRKKERKASKMTAGADDGETDLYSCDVCQKAFTSQSKLRRHSLAHTAERRFKCEFPECNYSTMRSDDIKKHERKHTGHRPYACTVDGCQFTASYAHHLSRHKRLHTGVKEFKCDVCGKEFHDSSTLKQHHLVVHSQEKPYSCDECNYATGYSHLLKDHQAQVHRGDNTNTKNYVCDECGHSYWRADQLKVHKRLHSGEKPFKCDVCSFASSHSNALKVHKRSHNNERPYVCEECAHAFARKDDLKTHMRIHSGDRPYACDRCPYTAAQKSNLKRHKISHLGIKPFCCDECGKRFAEASSLKMHKRLHAGVRPFKCPHCPYSTSQSGGLKRHLVSHSGEKPFVCHVCGKAFTLIYDLNNHSRIHTGEKPYSCDMCNFATSHHNALKIHKRSHTGEKPFRCDVCAQCFSRGGDLKTHKRIHTGEKPYACTVCCYTATQASNLKRHMTSHSGKKPFICGDCGKAFTEAGTLRIHRRTHTGERPYCCHHCAQAFSQAGHLRKHMRLHGNPNSNVGVARNNNGGTATANLDSSNSNGNTSLLVNTNSLISAANAFRGDMNQPILSSDSVHLNAMNLLSGNNTSSLVNNPSGVSNTQRLDDADTCGGNSNIENDLRHQCQDCGQCFDLTQQLAKHMASAHGNQDVDDDKSNVIIQLTIPSNC